MKEAHGLLAFIDQGIEYKSWEVMLQLYKTLVKLHMDHYIHPPVSTPEEVCGSNTESSEEIHQDVALEQAARGDGRCG